MARAIWKDTMLAESDDTLVVEGNHYFPPDSVNWQHFQDSERKTVCPWKGTASYYDITVNGDRNSAAAWTYRRPSSAAEKIRDHVAFWSGVRVES